MSDFTHLDQLLKKFAQSTVPGCGCAVAQKGKILYEGYYGMADLEGGRATQPDTEYRQYSLTKVSIFTACMMLFERGLFLLNDPLYAYFPEYRRTKKFLTSANGGVRIVDTEHPILVKHVLSMSCGLPYGRANAPYSVNPTQEAMNRMETELGKGPYTLREEIRRAAEVPVAFEPGTHFLYGFGSELAAGLIEVVTGKRIWDAMDELLFHPLGMKNTGMHYFGDVQKRLAVLYTPKETGFAASANDTDMDRRNRPGSENEGGCPRLFSTVPDYIILTQMLANGGMFRGEHFMGRKTIDLMRANQLTLEALKDFRGPYLDGYGYGCGVRTLMEQAPGCSASVGEFGWTGAAGTYCSVDPAEGVSVVYMHNMMPNQELYHHHRVRNAAYGGID